MAKNAVTLTKTQANAYYGATSLEAAAQALGLNGKTQFRPRVRAVLGKVSAQGMTKLWTRANASKLLSDASIVRAVARVSATKPKRTRTRKATHTPSPSPVTQPTE